MILSLHYGKLRRKVMRYTSRWHVWDGLVCSCHGELLDAARAVWKVCECWHIGRTGSRIGELLLLADWQLKYS